MITRKHAEATFIAVRTADSEPFGFDVFGAPDWHAEALCAEVGGDFWFPEKGGSTRDAKRICAGCEVRDKCLAGAVERRERFGIWGGLSERERRKLWNRDARAAA